MLKIDDLSVCYPGNQLASLTNFHLTMKPGEIVGIVGESGSGKSTVLKAILGALPKQTKILGEIKLEGDSLLQQTSEQWQKIRGTQLSLIFQDSSSALNPIRKIGTQYEEYILQHECLSKEEAQGKAKDMLLKMRLPNPESIMDSYPHQLSGGMCQRVGIAMAMTFTPQLLLADEPTSALDVVTQQQIVEELLRVRKIYNTSILLVTHNLAMAAYMADHLVVMEKGKIVDCGAVLEVLETPQSAYTRKLLAAVPELGGERCG